MSIGADFTVLAFFSALPAVFAVFLEIHTGVVTVGLSFGALGFHTLSFVAVKAPVAALDLGGELVAAFCVFDTNFVLSGLLVDLGGALKASFFALIGRAVGDTLVVFALLKVFANFPTFAFSPCTATAALGSFFASFAVLR